MAPNSLVIINYYNNFNLTVLMTSSKMLGTVLDKLVTIHNLIYSIYLGMPRT